MNLNVLFFVLLAFSLSSTFFICWIHYRVSSISHPHFIQPPEKSKLQEQQQLKEEPTIVAKPETHFSCKEFGGPDDDVAKQMVYWSDIPTDSKFVSPFKKNDRVQYLTFEPDGGGWNNIRMAMETFVVLAHAMGRTLVMPPAQRMYLLGQGAQKQKIHFNFADFFDLDLLRKEHDGLDIISMEEYLLREAGNFRDKSTPDELKMWLRNVTYTPKWNTDACILMFPSNINSNITHIKEVHKSLKFFQRNGEYMTPVNATLYDRMAEMLIGRNLRIYDQELQEERALHFMCYHKERVRYLVHFYAFLFFEDWKQQMWVNRLVRDHLRYIDVLQCSAARIVDALVKRSNNRNSSNSGQFDAFHIRRGDFQYDEVVVDASVLYESCKDVIPPNATVYVATDERDKTYFEPLAKHYDLVYLDDFLPLIQGLNTNYYGMLDQLIASQSRYFFGTYWSTFSGYINRIRGYHVTKNKVEGYLDGTMQSYYFLPLEVKNSMRHYAAIEQFLFAREYPTAWRDIDRGILEL